MKRHFTGCLLYAFIFITIVAITVKILLEQPSGKYYKINTFKNERYEIKYRHYLKNIVYANLTFSGPSYEVKVYLFDKINNKIIDEGKLDYREAEIIQNYRNGYQEIYFKLNKFRPSYFEPWRIQQ